MPAEDIVAGSYVEAVGKFYRLARRHLFAAAQTVFGFRPLYCTFLLRLELAVGWFARVGTGNIDAGAVGLNLKLSRLSVGDIFRFCLEPFGYIIRLDLASDVKGVKRLEIEGELTVGFQCTAFQIEDRHGVGYGYVVVKRIELLFAKKGFQALCRTGCDRRIAILNIVGCRLDSVGLGGLGGKINCAADFTVRAADIEHQHVVNVYPNVVVSAESELDGNGIITSILHDFTGRRVGEITGSRHVERYRKFYTVTEVCTFVTT